jgi:ribosomal protein S27AE
MTRHAGMVRTCPDCGGILQATEPERLTSVEVAESAGASEPAFTYQCLLCGYTEVETAEPATVPSR